MEIYKHADLENCIAGILIIHKRRTQATFYNWDNNCKDKFAMQKFIDTNTYKKSEYPIRWGRLIADIKSAETDWAEYKKLSSYEAIEEIFSAG